jgi:spoIIIJ-associated protein
MSHETRDFYGKDVPEAIKEACEHFGVAQEHLTIEVLETGSKGIFGLIRQKAQIRASVQEFEAPPQHFQAEQQAEKQKAGSKNRSARPNRRLQTEAGSDSETAAAAEQTTPVKEQSGADNHSDARPDDGATEKQEPQLAEASRSLIRDELQELLALMGCPSEVSVEQQAGTIHCRVSAEHQEILISEEGRVLDSLQYLLRKIVSKKIGGRIQLSIDVGDYREKRYQQLRELAIGQAAQVKEDGKTQVIASLNPSERRVVHVALQDDPEVRSRSVGDGLFKKVLIFKPGKAKKGGNRRRSRPHSRRKNNSGRKQEV